MSNSIYPVLRVGPWARGRVTNVTFVDPVTTPNFGTDEYPVNLAKTNWSNQSWSALVRTDVDSTAGAITNGLSNILYDSWVSYAHHSYDFYYQATSSFDMTFNAYVFEENNEVIGDFYVESGAVEDTINGELITLGSGFYTHTLTLPATRLGSVSFSVFLLYTGNLPAGNGILGTEIT